MITRIEVDNFKSLTDFSLNFSPGLNVLVGPNGSGKTNIVSFFEYLAHLMETDSSDATSRAGGAGAVFRRIGQGYEKRIKARLIGCVRTRSEIRRAKGSQESSSKPPYYLYEYTMSLLFPDTLDSVVFEKQRFRLKRVTEFTLREETKPDEKWGLDIVSELGAEGSPIVGISGFDEELLDFRYYPVRGGGKGNKKHQIERTLSRMLEGNGSLVAIISRYSPDMWGIAADISGGQIYNIVPSRVKMPEDSAKPPGIARDGSGLAATLYALQRSKHPEEFRPWRFPHLPHHWYSDPSALDQLKGYLQLVNSAIDNIQVSNDTFDNQLRVRFDIQSGSYSAMVPMALMSDGTLKWVALVTAALTATSVFSIEEPENYLHPQMQGQIVGILREILFGQQSERFTLMTTHSETLLNHCKPEELVIVSMRDGKTVAARCSNEEEISDEIARTGFGLGYYYISNALENE